MQRTASLITANQGSEQGVEPDGQLIEDAGEGSAEAIDTLVTREWGRAFRAAYLIVGDHHRAEEVTQEAVIKAFDRITSFDTSRPFGPWLHRIVVNQALDLVRAEHSRPQPGTGDDVGTKAPSADMPGSNLHPSIVDALHQLPAEARAVVVMKHVLDYRSAEIAESLGKSEGAVRTQLHRAMEALRASIGGDQ